VIAIGLAVGAGRYGLAIGVAASAFAMLFIAVVFDREEESEL
jgi:hypothetical protein